MAVLSRLKESSMKVNTKSKKVNKAWLNSHVNDPYVKAAQKDGYRARAAYKLKEIDEQLKLIRPGATVVDLGSTPGSTAGTCSLRSAKAGTCMSVSRSKVSRTPSVRVGCIRVSSVIVRGSRGDFVVDARNRLGRRAQLGKKGQRPLARETHDGAWTGSPLVEGPASMEGTNTARPS